MPPFTIKVVIVHANGDVEQHQVMLDAQGCGMLVRTPTPQQPLSSAEFIMCFAHGARYEGHITFYNDDAHLVFAPSMMAFGTEVPQPLVDSEYEKV